jgi:putative flippase GtrA
MMFDPFAVAVSRLPERHRPAGAEFLRFGTVGVGGFCVDVACVYALRGALGLYGAGMVAYFVAASANWALNRVWTFRGRADGATSGAAGRAHIQWLRFLAVNLVGFALNRGVYSLLIATEPLARSEPVVAVAAGAGSGFLVNFFLSRAIVFR